MQKVIAVFYCAILCCLLLCRFIKHEKEKVKWLSIAEMQVAYKKKPKPILVDVYTSWCGWCKVMDKETYSNEKVAAYINEKYYAVKFDAESKDSVEWNGKKYGYNAQNKINDLAQFI